jgi:hypothetical protein
MSEAQPAGSKRRGWKLSSPAALLLVLLLPTLLYLPALRNDFTWDDRIAAMGRDGDWVRPEVEELQAPWTYFALPYWPPRNIGDDKLYRPITVLTFALRHALFGDAPLPAHLLNLILHLLAVLLVHRFLRALACSHTGALLGALVFGMHAIHSEVVAGIVGRSELLAFDAGMLAILQAFQAMDCAQTRARFTHLTLASLALFAAFASKENALAFAAFLPLACYARAWRAAANPGGSQDAPEARTRSDRPSLTWKQWLPLVAIPTLVFLLLRHQALAASRGNPITWLENPWAGLSPLARIPSAMIAWAYALLLTFLPFGLAVDHGPGSLPTVAGPSDPLFWLAALIATGFCGLVWLAVRHRHRAPLLFLALACWFGFSVITSNVPFAVNLVLAERSYFIPSLACSLLVAWSLEHLPERKEIPALGLTALSAWIGMSAFMILERVPVWKDNQTLVAHEVANRPESVRMRIVASHYALLDERAQHAAHHLEAALVHAPNLGRLLHEYGWVLEKLGRKQEAIAAYEAGLRGRIDDRRWTLRLHAKLAIAKGSLSQIDQALEHVLATLRIHSLYLNEDKDLRAFVQHCAERPDVSTKTHRTALQLLDIAARPPR